MSVTVLSLTTLRSTTVANADNEPSSSVRAEPENSAQIQIAQ